MDNSLEFLFRRVSKSDRMIFVLNKNRKLIFANQSWLTFRGSKLVSEQNREFLECIHVEDKTEFEKETAEALRVGEPVNSSFRIVSGNGDYHWYHTILTPEFHANNIVLVVYCSSAQTRMEQDRQTQRLASVISSSPSGAVIKDRDGCITDWSLGAEKIVGYTAQEMKGQSVDIYLTNEQRQLSSAIHERVLQGEHILNWVTTVIRKDKSVILCSCSYSPVFDSWNQVVGSIVLFHDVTEDKAADAQSKKMAAIFASSNTGIILKDREGCILEWNVGAEAILGYTAEEMVGKTSKAFAWSESFTDIDCITERLNRGEHIAQVELLRRHKNGEAIYCSTSYTPVFNDENEVIGSAAIFHDSTQSKIAERKALNLSAIFSGVDVGIALKDKNGVIVDWNIGAQNILGYTAEEAIGIPVNEYVSDEEKIEMEELDRKLLQGETIAHLEVEWKHKNDKLVNCSVSHTPILDKEGQVGGSVVIFHDVTERRIAERKLQNLMAIISVADAGIILKDRDGVILDWNIGAKNILGYEPDEMVGKTTKNYAPEKGYDEIDDINERLLRGEHISHVEVIRKHKNGHLIYCSASYTPTCDNRGNITGSIAIFHDISEKKQIEMKHSELESTLTNLFANLTNAFCLYEWIDQEDGTEDFRIVMANKAFEELIGYKSETAGELVGKLYSDVCSGIFEDLHTCMTVVKTKNGKTYEAYNHSLKKHLNTVIFSPVQNHVAVLITDRTHLVEAENALWARENDLALLFSSMSSGFCLGKLIRDENGDVVDILYEMVNAAYEQMEGHGVMELNGKRMRELLAEEDEIYFYTFVDVATNQTKATFKKYISSRDTTLDVVCYSPNPDYFVCLENDITERVKAENELKKAYMDTEAILHEMPAPICVVGKQNGMILGCNTAFVTLCRSDNAENILRSPITHYFIPNEQGGSIIDLLHQGINFKCKMPMLDGSETEVKMFSQPFVYKEQEAFAVYCMDLTQQRQQEMALRDAALTAEEASKMKSMFLANMSHEIRTPMNGIIGFTELALEDTSIDKKPREYLEKIKISAQGLLEIINDVLDISKIEAGRVELEKVPFSLHEVFKHCETISGVKAAEKGISLYFYSEPIVEKKLVGDPTRLRQVLLNLLSNAIKFTNTGIVKLLSMVEEIGPNRVLANFEVKDSGIGMTSEQIQKIFEPFTQGDNSTTRKYGGTGLGLAITKNIIELMGGELAVDSALGIGSRFSFTLMFDTIDEPAGMYTTHDEPITSVMKPIFAGEILVCEDNAINQQVVSEHLTRIGLLVTIAANGKIGVDYVRARLSQNKPFDLILMDIHMPVMDGLEATKKLLALGNPTPIVAMTANVMTADKESYIRVGMTDYIGKPFVAQELWDCLLRYLEPVEWILLEQSQQPSIDFTFASVINQTLGRERAASDDVLYRRLLNNFYKSNKNTMPVLLDAIRLGNISVAHRVAHTLKGVANTIGATELGEAAFVVETVLAKGNADCTPGQLQKLEIELHRVMTELTQILEKTEGNSDRSAQPKTNKELDKHQATQLMSRLEPLLHSGDSECMEMIDEIRNSFEPLGEICDTLIEEIEDYEFELAGETLQKIKNMLEV